ISFPRPLSGAVAGYMQVRNRRRAFLALELFTLVTLVVSLFTLGRVSPLAACIAVGVTFLLRLVVAALLLRSLDRGPVWTFFRAQLPPLAASLVMAGAVTGVRLGLARAGIRAGVSLIVQLAIGVAVYIAAARIFAPSTWREAMTLIQKGLARRRPRKPV